MIRYIFLLVLSFTLFSIPAKADNQTAFLARVITVIDGDSLKVRKSNGQKVQVRLQGVDAPEYDQPYSKESKEILESLLSSKDVWVIQTGIDKYERIVAHVFPIGSDAGLNMIEHGGAWAYRHYNPPKIFIRAEKEARTNKQGLWALPKNQITAPWDWRYSKKQAEK